MRVTVEMTPAQVAAYCDTAGIDRSELREDVRTYVRTALQGSPELSTEDGATEGIDVR